MPRASASSVAVSHACSAITTSTAAGAASLMAGDVNWSSARKRGCGAGGGGRGECNRGGGGLRCHGAGGLCCFHACGAVRLGFELGLLVGGEEGRVEEIVPDAAVERHGGGGGGEVFGHVS